MTNWRSTSGEATERSICVICPIFSGRVMRERRSSTRSSTLRPGSLYRGGGAFAAAIAGKKTTEPKKKRYQARRGPNLGLISIFPDQIPTTGEKEPSLLPLQSPSSPAVISPRCAVPSPELLPLRSFYTSTSIEEPRDSPSFTRAPPRSARASPPPAINHNTRSN